MTTRKTNKEEIEELVEEATHHKDQGSESKIKFLQYLNTVILTVVGTITMIIFVTLNNVKNDQMEYAKELLRLKTVQDINVASVKAVDQKADIIDARVDKLELNYLDYIKSWVDDNYIRKPQSK